jgi:hypothetical protein
MYPHKLGIFSLFPQSAAVISKKQQDIPLLNSTTFGQTQTGVAVPSVFPYFSAYLFLNFPSKVKKHWSAL